MPEYDLEGTFKEDGRALNGFVIAVTGDGYIFYISPSVQDYLGFHQSDLIHQSVYELIRADDRAVFHRQLQRTPLHAADSESFPPEQPLLARRSATSSPQHLHAEKQSLVERSFTCRFRCLLDNSLGFLALNFHGGLKFPLGQQKSAADKSPSAFFAIATLLPPICILELRTKTPPLHSNTLRPSKSFGKDVTKHFKKLTALKGLVTS
ncbi:LOW QUALITY PROTEIN: aryl hydrocarbon receptor-like [Anomalospiza imberbis]|uniref:LOW QUALITY PROTEIN: aryl hydrocarbon receptor-like n=1 Tax=Anomalospiza imberbis TaxID=187417 RepID=UPI00358E380E